MKKGKWPELLVFVLLLGNWFFFSLLFPLSAKAVSCQGVGDASIEAADKCCNFNWNKGCSDPQKLDRYDSSSRISLNKGDTRCQSDEHSRQSSRPRWC